MTDGGYCAEFVTKRPSDPGSLLYCRRCGLHIDIHDDFEESGRD